MSIRDGVPTSIFGESLSPPTIFLSAATVDLQTWRDVLHGAFSRGGVRVLTQNHSLGAAPAGLREFLVDHIAQADCVIHLAGQGYGWDADEPFPDDPDFVCSWTQFEYYHAHALGKPVLAYACGGKLSTSGFTEPGDARSRSRKARLQREHWERVRSGTFDRTPLAGRAKPVLNETVDDVEKLLGAVAAAVRKLHQLGDAAPRVAAEMVRRNLNQLPPRPALFVGRESHLATLRALDPGAGAVITGLKGMGGIGKTALALVLAHEWKDRFPDAQFWLDGRGSAAEPPSAQQLLEQVLRAFDPQAPLPDDPVQLRGLYHQALGGQRMLVVLDNAENGRQAGPLVPPAGCGMIVTSRVGIALDQGTQLKLGKLDGEEGVALLRALYPPLTDGEGQELIRLCAGLPLALRLAGAHLQLDAIDREGGRADVAGYLRALKGERLKTFDRDAKDADLVTIDETLALSERPLTEGEREGWRKLGVFAGSFDAAAAREIAGADEGTLDMCVRRSLLEREETRYRLHDLAREYAVNRLREGGTEVDVRLAHARHFAGVGKAANRQYLAGDVVGGLAEFDRERGEIAGAFRWLRGRTDAAADRLLVQLVHAVAYTGDLRFHARERIVWLEGQRLAAQRVGDRRGEGAALGNLGLAYADLGEARRAIAFYEQQLELTREIGDRRGEGNALGSLGNAYANLGETRRAIEFYEQQLEITHEIGDRRGEGNALGSLGLAYAALGEMRRAIELYEQRLVIAREIGDRRGEGNALGNLGTAYLNLGEARQAIEFYEKGLVIDREIGDRRGEGNALGSLGVAYKILGETRRAIEYCEQQLAIVREIGDRRGEGNALWNAAVALWSLDERAEAIERGAAALRIFEAIESPHAKRVREQLAAWRGVL